MKRGNIFLTVKMKFLMVGTEECSQHQDCLKLLVRRECVLLWWDIFSCYKHLNYETKHISCSPAIIIIIVLSSHKISFIKDYFYYYLVRMLQGRFLDNHSCWFRLLCYNKIRFGLKCLYYPASKYSWTRARPRDTLHLY